MFIDPLSYIFTVLRIGASFPFGAGDVHLSIPFNRASFQFLTTLFTFYQRRESVLFVSVATIGLLDF